VALDAATKGFRDAITEKLGDKVTFIEQNAAGDSATCSTICNQFVSEKVDLIMANATPALQAAAASTDTIPILGTSVTDYATALDISNWNGTTGKNISGTSDLAPLDGQAAMFGELLPDVKTIGILYCSAEANSKYQADTVEGLLTAAGYTVNVYTFADSNDIANVVTTACANCDALYIPTDNTAASATETVSNVALPAGKPIICGEEGLCSGCGIATLSISYYDLGFATGKMAVEILKNGKDVSAMEVEFAPTFTKKFNADNCSKLGINVPQDYVAIG
jgi:putative ABC transport system substrate-binding protein